MEVGLSNITAEALLAELKRRLDGITIDALRYGCTCSADKRRTIECKGDETFHPRTGCLSCGLWDGPPVLRRP